MEKGVFAIRGGGHSPISGAASINGGVLIDLSSFREVEPSKDGSTVTIGAGAKWEEVSTALDERGLAVVGGRNSAVGVGGLALGGKVLIFTSVFISGSSYQFLTPNIRRPLLLFPSVRISMLQYPELRNRPCIRSNRHSLYID